MRARECSAFEGFSHVLMSFWPRLQLPLPLRRLRATGRHCRGSAPGLRLWRALHVHRGEQAEDRRLVAVL